MPQRTSLSNFYLGVQRNNKRLASKMSSDILCVTVNSVLADNSSGQASADRLRRLSEDLSTKDRLILNNALTELGYS